jgi:hypothetical protein
MFEKEEFINHTGKSPQPTREVKDELQTTIPMGSPFRRSFAGLKWLAASECSAVQLGDYGSRKLSARGSGTTGE